MNSGASGPVASKFRDLLSALRNAETAVLAYSGGVDSSFLLKAMKLSGIRFLKQNQPMQLQQFRTKSLLKAVCKIH